MVLGDHDFGFPKSVPRGGLGEGKISGGIMAQDSLLGEHYSVSTEMVHEVGGDSAEVKGQDVPVIVGVGSLMGKAFIASRAGWVVAARVVAGLYGLFLITVSVKGILPLWAKQRESQKLGHLAPSPLTPACLAAPMLPGEGLAAPGAEREGQGGSCGCVGLGRGCIAAQVRFGAGRGSELEWQRERVRCGPSRPAGWMADRRMRVGSSVDEAGE